MFGWTELWIMTLLREERYCHVSIGMVKSRLKQIIIKISLWRMTIEFVQYIIIVQQSNVIKDKNNHRAWCCRQRLFMFIIKCHMKKLYELSNKRNIPFSCLIRICDFAQTIALLLHLRKSLLVIVIVTVARMAAVDKSIRRIVCILQTLAFYHISVCWLCFPIIVLSKLYEISYISQSDSLTGHTAHTILRQLK